LNSIIDIEFTYTGIAFDNLALIRLQNKLINVWLMVFNRIHFKMQDL